MRRLTDEEIEFGLDDNGESEEGAIAIEATIQELADKGASTSCGKPGNKCFNDLVDCGYGHRKCRGWLVNDDNPEVLGMFHIKIQTDKTAEKISEIAGGAGGSLRFDGDSAWEGYKEFEIE